MRVSDDPESLLDGHRTIGKVCWCGPVEGESKCAVADDKESELRNSNSDPEQTTLNSLEYLKGQFLDSGHLRDVFISPAFCAHHLMVGLERLLPDKVVSRKVVTWVALSR